MGKRLLCSGGAQASCHSTKGLLIGNKKLKKTRRDGAEIREGEVDAQGMGGRRTQRHHSGSEGEWAASQGGQGGGTDVRLMEAGRGRKGPPEGRTLGPTGNWEQVEEGKGGEMDEGR